MRQSLQAEECQREPELQPHLLSKTGPGVYTGPAALWKQKMKRETGVKYNHLPAEQRFAIAASTGCRIWFGSSVWECTDLT